MVTLYCPAARFFRRAGRVLRAPVFRTVSGALVFGFGAAGLARALELGDQIRRGVLCLA